MSNQASMQIATPIGSRNSNHPANDDEHTVNRIDATTPAAKARNGKSRRRSSGTTIVLADSRQRFVQSIEEDTSYVSSGSDFNYFFHT